MLWCASAPKIPPRTRLRLTGTPCACSRYANVAGYEVKDPERKDLKGSDDGLLIRRRHQSFAEIVSKADSESCRLLLRIELSLCPPPHDTGPAEIIRAPPDNVDVQLRHNVAYGSNIGAFTRKLSTLHPPKVAREVEQALTFAMIEVHHVRDRGVRYQDKPGNQGIVH